MNMYNASLLQKSAPNQMNSQTKSVIMIIFFILFYLDRKALQRKKGWKDGKLFRKP